MKNIMLMCIAAYASLLGGYLSPANGILIFFVLTIILFLWFSPIIKIKKDVFVVLIFSLYSAASTLWAGDKWASIMFSCSFLSGALLYLILRNYEDWEDKLLFVLVYCGIINGILSIFQICNGNDVVGLFYNRNPYSGFLTPLVPISIYLYQKSNKTVFLYMTSFLIFSNLLSNSRAGMISMLLALFVIFIYFLIKKDKKSAKSIVLTICSGLALFILFTYTTEFLLKQSASLTSAEGGMRASISRFYFFERTFKLFLESPLFGHGINSIKGLFDTVVNYFVFMVSHSHAHNIFLNMLIEIGSVGLLIFLYFLFMVVKGPFFSSRFSLKVALLSFLLHNMYEYNFPAPPFQMLFYTLSASILTGNDSKINFIEIKVWMKKTANYSILIYFFTLIAPQYVGFHYFDKAKQIIKNQDIDGAYKYLLYASTFSYASSMVQESMADFLNQIYMSSPELKNEQMMNDIEKYYLKALKLNNVNGEIYMGMAKFYFKTGKPELSEKYLIKVVDLFPYNQMYKIEMARFYKATGKIAKAIKLLTNVDDFFRTYAPLFPLRTICCIELAECYRTEGNLKLYWNYKEKAERLKKLQ
jgi:O-antigen ligase/tetratricopeptide (TPR) repeat protein